MPKKKIAENEPVIAVEGGAAVAPAKAPAKQRTAAAQQSAEKKARAPRASAKAVTHKHKRTSVAATVEPAAEIVPAVAAPVAAPAQPEPTYEEVSQLAYSYWVARGYQGGSQEEDWFRAVSELRSLRG